MLKVIKRTGEIVDFNKKKIEDAIMKAMTKGSGFVNENVAKLIAKDAEDSFGVDKEAKVPIRYIESFVYDALVAYGEAQTAKAYEGYRAVQEFKRNSNTTDESILELISKKNEDVMKENSNKNPMVNSTQRDLIAGEVSKDIARRKLIPAHIVQAHDEGAIHWHDLDYSISPMFNCCLVNLEDMFANGTVINDKLVETPKSFSTACTVATQIIAQVSSNQYGGQSITIAHLAPYLRKTYEKAYKHYFEDMGFTTVESGKLAKDIMMKELKDGIQTIRYQLSTLMTSNG